MGMLAVFCTNAINILAGINGLEVGQSIVIACFILAHNYLEMRDNPDPVISHNHLFSALFLLPFVTLSLALLRYNWQVANSTSLLLLIVYLSIGARQKYLLVIRIVTLLA